MAPLPELSTEKLKCLGDIQLDSASLRENLE